MSCRITQEPRIHTSHVKARGHIHFQDLSNPPRNRAINFDDYLTLHSSLPSDEAGVVVDSQGKKKKKIETFRNQPYFLIPDIFGIGAI